MESVYLTILSAKVLSADSAPKYQCYRYDMDTDRTYGRYSITSDTTSQYQDVIVSNHNSPEKLPIIKIIDIPEYANNGFGIFDCNGTHANKTSTIVPIILLRSDGKR